MLRPAINSNSMQDNNVARVSSFSYPAAYLFLLFAKFLNVRLSFPLSPQRKRQKVLMKFMRAWRAGSPALPCTQIGSSSSKLTMTAGTFLGQGRVQCFGMVSRQYFVSILPDLRADGVVGLSAASLSVKFETFSPLSGTLQGKS